MPQPIYDLVGVALRLLDMQNRATDAKDFAGYTLEWLPLAANAQRQKASFTVNSDVDFVALSATWYATDTGAPPVEQLTLQALINLSLADRQVFDRDTHIKAAFGQQTTNGFPLLFPLWLPRSSTLTGFLTNLDAANARNVRLTLSGFILHAGRNANTSRQGGF